MVPCVFKNLRVKFKDEDAFKKYQTELEECELLYYYETYGFLTVVSSRGYDNPSALIGFETAYKTHSKNCSVNHSDLIPYDENDLPQNYSEFYIMYNIEKENESQLNKIILEAITHSSKISEQLVSGYRKSAKGYVEKPKRIK